jgi:hypothetical protein
VQHFYDSTGLLVLTQEWENSYENKIKKDSYQKFYYNSQRQLLKDESYMADRDTPYYQSIYDYDQNGNNIRSIHGANQYIFKYDSINRLTQRRQLWSGNMTTGNWVENYWYTDTSQVVFCDVYYDDTIIDYSTRTINSFKENRIVSSEHDYLLPHTSFPYKYTYEYNRKGLLSSIKMYRKLSATKDYEITSNIIISYKGINVITKQTSDLINKTLYHLESQ